MLSAMAALRARSHGGGKAAILASSSAQGAVPAKRTTKGQDEKDFSKKNFCSGRGEKENVPNKTYRSNRLQKSDFKPAELDQFQIGTLSVLLAIESICPPD